MSEPLSRVKVGTLRRPEGPPEPMVVVPVDVEKEDVRILKVCFYSNSFNPGKNFKLVKCTVQTEIQVSVAASVPPSTSWTDEQLFLSLATSSSIVWAGQILASGKTFSACCTTLLRLCMQSYNIPA